MWRVGGAFKSSVSSQRAWSSTLSRPETPSIPFRAKTSILPLTLLSMLPPPSARSVANAFVGGRASRCNEERRVVPGKLSRQMLPHDDVGAAERKKGMIRGGALAGDALLSASLRWLAVRRFFIGLRRNGHGRQWRKRRRRATFVREHVCRMDAILNDERVPGRLPNASQESCVTHSLHLQPNRQTLPFRGWRLFAPLEKKRVPRGVIGETSSKGEPSNLLREYIRVESDTKERRSGRKSSSVTIPRRERAPPPSPPPNRRAFSNKKTHSPEEGDKKGRGRSEFRQGQNVASFGEVVPFSCRHMNPPPLTREGWRVKRLRLTRISPRISCVGEREEEWRERGRGRPRPFAKRECQTDFPFFQSSSSRIFRRASLINLTA